MKREIKFRAKNKRTGAWEFFTLKEVRKVYDLIDWDTVGQAFGLNDKQGKEMYDGDILKHHNGRLSAPLEFPKDYLWLKARTENAGWQLAVEIVGNRDDNPDLVKRD